MGGDSGWAGPMGSAHAASGPMEPPLLSRSPFLQRPVSSLGFPPSPAEVEEERGKGECGRAGDNGEVLGHIMELGVGEEAPVHSEDSGRGGARKKGRGLLM